MSHLSPLSPLDRILELKDEAEKQKVELTPGVKAYIQTHLEIVQEKLRKREAVTEDDMKFIDEVKGKIALLRVLAMMRDQIDFVQKNAIHPREGDAPLPDRETILRSIQRTLTPDQARTFLDKKEVNEPTLVLVPVTSPERYTEALQAASQIMEGSQEPYLSEFTQTRLNELATQAEVEGTQIKQWRFAITEGAQTFPIPEWDNGQETFQERISRFNIHYGTKGITRVDFPTYIALMHQGLRQGKPTDCEYLNHSRKAGAKSDWQYTLLNETNQETGLVGAGYWHYDFRNVYLYVYNLDNQSDNARFRPSVVGDIEI